MEISDFKSGQTVFVVNLCEGRNMIPSICEHTIEKVGRKYVTLLSGNRYETCDWCEFGLYESRDWGDRTYLCPSMTDAKMLIEKRELEIWLNRLNVISKGNYTLEQLRKVKEILGD